MKIIDTFIFYNELDLLKYRLAILDEHVDYFILVESTHTFTGHPKPLFYNENKENNEYGFAVFKDKIIHIIVDDFPFKYPNIDHQRQQQWQNEYHQRNYIRQGLHQIQNNLNDDDIILTADVDEIPDPKIIEKAKNDTLDFDKNTLNRLALDMYYYNLNLRVGDGQNWHGIKLMTWSAYNKIHLTFQQMRVWEHTHSVPRIPYGGWHLSYFGDIDFIINKVTNFSHQEYNNNMTINKERLEKMVKEGINFHGGANLQNISINNNNNLPYKYEEYLQKYYVPV